MLTAGQSSPYHSMNQRSTTGRFVESTAGPGGTLELNVHTREESEGGRASQSHDGERLLHEATAARCACCSSIMYSQLTADRRHRMDRADMYM